MPFPPRSGRVAADRSVREQRLDATQLIARVGFGARVVRLAAGLLAVAVLLFALPMQLPGGAEAAFLGPHVDDPVARAALQRASHVDRAPTIAFFTFVTDAVRGDLGHSPVSGVDVGAVVGERLLDSAALASAAGVIAFAFVVPWRRRARSRRRALRRRKARALDDGPSSNFVPGAVWVLPLFAAVGVAVRFGAIPAPDPHAAILSRVGAGLLPAAALALALAVWAIDARHGARDTLAALLVGTLVTEAVFGLPGIGTLLEAAATRPDPLMLRGALLGLSAVAVITSAVFVPALESRRDATDVPTVLRRATNGTLATFWVLALLAAVVARSHLDLAPPGRTGTRVLQGLSATHPFGTDVLGRDVLARVLATARGSLLLVVAAMVIATVAGSAIGVVVAFAGGRAERIGIAALVVWAAFPGELVALAFLAFNGRDGNESALAFAAVAAPALAIGAQRRALDALQRSTVPPGADGWLRSVVSRASPGLFQATLATMFVGASRVVVVEMVAGFLGLGPAATQTWSHEAATQLAFAAQAPWAVIAPVSAALVTAVALAGLGNAIRPSRTV